MIHTSISAHPCSMDMGWRLFMFGCSSGGALALRFFPAVEPPLFAEAPPRLPLPRAMVPAEVLDPRNTRDEDRSVKVLQLQSKIGMLYCLVCTRSKLKLPKSLFYPP